MVNNFNYRNWDKSELSAWQKGLAERMFEHYRQMTIPSDDLVQEYNATVTETNRRIRATDLVNKYWSSNNV